MKRRLRAPSPAFVVSLIALFVALGGTSLAATKAIAAKHKDAKQDTALVKKLAPSLSVKHAATADNATNADQRHERHERHQRHQRHQRDQPRRPRGYLLRAGDPPSGKSESGVYAVSSSSATTGFLFEGATFPIPLAAPLDGSHVAWINGATTTNCPGVGQAAAGWLCVYAAQASNVTPDNSHPINTHGGNSGADAYGFMVNFDATGTFAFTYGSWTVTAP